MLAGLRALLRGLNDMRLQGYIYIWANLAFVALSLPLVTMPAAYAALCKVAHQAQTDSRSSDSLGLFWETFRAQLWTALPWGLVMAGTAFMIVSNMFAYALIDGIVVQALRVTWILGLCFWLAVFLFTWPLYYEMDEPTVWGASRNAVVLALRNPMFTVIIILGVLVLAVVSTLTFIAWLLLSCGAIAAVGSAAVIDRLAAYRAERGSDAVHS